MKRRRMLASFLMLLLAGLLCAGALAADTGTKGDCGRAAKYELDPKGTLTITGSGRMDNYSASTPAPWKSFAGSIKKVEFKGSVTSVGSCAFEGCTSLTAVTLRPSVNRISADAFADCTKLTDIDFSDGVTFIDDRAFAGCRALEEITIPASVNDLGSKVFKDCVKLYSAQFAGVPATIGDCMFEGCVELTFAEIPVGFTSIPDSFFRDCTYLAIVTIPESVTTIEEDAFLNCERLAVVDYLGSEEQWKTITIKSGNTALEGAAINYNADMNADDAASYVWRAYSVILGRQGDGAGVLHWMEELENGASAGEIIAEFFRSDEYASRGFSNEETVKRCYQAMLGREPDAAETANWAAMLADGFSTTKLVSEFTASEEFAAICAAAGLNPGSIELGPRDQNSSITRFVQRCYAVALGREADEDGLNEWCAHLLTQDQTPERVAFGFVFSPEAQRRVEERELYVKMLYNLMLDRLADADGLKNWVSALESYERSYGTDQGRQEIYKLFAASEEFGLMLKNFGF